MATQRGWWKITYTGVDDSKKIIELDDSDLEHIAELIKQGYTSGEIYRAE